mgnify:CR=1 FL=1
MSTNRDLLDGMTVFVQVVEQGSFTLAAGFLNHSTSYISKEVSRLENRLGVRLLNRSTRKISLTDSGKTYYEYCRQIVADAEEAERSGLVSRVVPVKKLKEEALGAAQKIAEKSVLTSMAVKEAVNRSYETTLSEGILFERRLFHSLFATEDQKEGMAAFLEKRQAQFRDK